MCLARGSFGVRGLGLGFTNPAGTRGKCDMCLWWYEWVGGCGQGLGGWGGVMSVCVVSLDSLC